MSFNCAQPCGIGAGRLVRAEILAALVFLQSGPSFSQTTLSEAPAEFPSTPSGPEALSPEELDAFGLVMESGPPSQVIVRAEAFHHQYPDSQLLPLAQLREMRAEIQINSYEGAVALGQELLRQNPNNLEALVLLAGVLPNFPPAYSAERKAKALKQAADDIQGATQLLHTFHIMEGVSVNSFLQNKRRLYVSLKEAAAFLDLVSANYEGAIRQYQAALAEDPAPSAVTYLRLGMAYYAAGQLDRAGPPLEKAMQADTEVIRQQAGKLLKDITSNRNAFHNTPSETER